MGVDTPVFAIRTFTNTPFRSAQSEPTSLQCRASRNLTAKLFSDVCISCPRLVPLGDITYSTKESRPNAKRPRQSNISERSSPVSKRFKTGAPNTSPDAKARRIVEGYDEELTCPLCVFCSSVNGIKVNVATQMLRLLVSFWSKPESTRHYSQCFKRCNACCESLWSFSVRPLHR